MRNSLSSFSHTQNSRVRRNCWAQNLSLLFHWQIFHSVLSVIGERTTLSIYSYNLQNKLIPVVTSIMLLITSNLRKMTHDEAGDSYHITINKHLLPGS